MVAEGELPPIPSFGPGAYVNQMNPDPMAPFGVAAAPSDAASVHQPADADSVDVEAPAPREPQEYSLRSGNLVDNLDSSRHDAQQRLLEAKQQREMMEEAEAREKKMMEEAEARKNRPPSPPSPTSSESSTSSSDDAAAGKADLLAIRL